METNKPKFLLCVKYDPAVVIANQQMQAFKQHDGSCSDCGAKVLMSQASFELLAHDKEVKPICPTCATKLEGKLGRPQLAVTAGHVKEIASWLAKRNAARN